MDTEVKVISGIVVFLLMMIAMVIHADTKGKQALMRELGSPVSYFEAMGIEKQFIEGRIFEQLKQ